MNIEVDFTQYLPTLGMLYGNYQILKAEQFIDDVMVVPTPDGQHQTLRILKKVITVDQ
jgi:hypothetical protein